MIVIVDYGVGNLGSIRNMLRRAGAPAAVSGDVAQVRRASKLVLPGVGHFDEAMRRIGAVPGLREALDAKALDEGVPVLGICLGMQLLGRGSEEGVEKGLGWIDAQALRFPERPGLKVPHMGWNLVAPTRPSPLTAGLPPDARFYFVHSYYLKARRPEDTILQAEHGVRFDAAVSHGNVAGVQFHPEKSHRFGLQLLGNFARA